MWAALKVVLLWIPVLVTGSTVDFICETAAEYSLSVIILLNDHCPEIWIKEIFQNPRIPVVILSTTDVYVKSQEFSRPLHVQCLPGQDLQQDLELLQKEINPLKDFPTQKKLIYVTNRSADGTRMESLLETFYRRRMPNIIGLLAADEHLYFYRYNSYPTFKTEQLPLQSSIIFDREFPNMQGHPLIVMPDQWLPRSILYADRRTGKQVLAGSVGRFIHVLAWKLNATLQLAPTVTSGRFLHAADLQKLGKSMCIDVPASMSMVERGEQLARTSYPLELTHICLMIPVAQEIPLRDIYFLLSSVSNMLLAVGIVFTYGLVFSLIRKINNRDVHLADFLLNDRALRGILGQSFRMPSPRSSSSRWIYVVLGIVGLNVSSIFEAALETMMAHPPREFQARSFSDLQRTRIPLVTTEDDLHTLVDLHLTLLVVNVSEYHHLRNGRNSSNSYFASRLHWTLFSEQQKRFSRELFIYSMDACLWSLALFSFQWPQSSLFADPVSKLILDVRANGLYQFWVGMHHFDMTEAGLASMEDPSLRRNEVMETSALQLVDLQWVWLAYGTLLGIALLIFLLEVSWRSISGSLFIHTFIG
ncbi:uncharacterized protein LOC108023062 [Drosophila biarmipes]|uniref:uncharacterized protein LOC108023062 n=1 Tax=Drosophila biarmipes TaxID=125945 RepID=UPI0007E8050C|nr:uncharacterized protein LOC108023062 [Drosophila biarmipes]